MVDSEGICCSVTVYNIVQGWGVKIGDSVAIAEPFLQRVDVQHQDQVMSFDATGGGGNRENWGQLATPNFWLLKNVFLSESCSKKQNLVPKIPVLGTFKDKAEILSTCDVFC